MFAVIGDDRLPLSRGVSVRRPFLTGLAPSGTAISTCPRRPLRRSMSMRLPPSSTPRSRCTSIQSVARSVAVRRFGTGSLMRRTRLNYFDTASLNTAPLEPIPRPRTVIPGSGVADPQPAFSKYSSTWTGHRCGLPVTCVLRRRIAGCRVLVVPVFLAWATRPVGRGTRTRTSCSRCPARCGGGARR